MSDDNKLLKLEVRVFACLCWFLLAAHGRVGGLFGCDRAEVLGARRERFLHATIDDARVHAAFDGEREPLVEQLLPEPEQVKQ